MSNYRRIDEDARPPGSGQILRHLTDRYRWQVKVYLGRSNGRKKYVARVVHGVKGDAEAVLGELIAEARALPTDPVPPATTVREYLRDHFLPDREKTVAPATLEFYTYLAEKHIIPRFGKRSISSLTLIAMSGFDKLLRADGVNDRAREAACNLLAQARRHATEQARGKNQAWM